MKYKIPAPLKKYKWYAPHLAWLGIDMDGDYPPRRADLRGADLRGADLSDADLRWADLSWANGEFSTGYFGKHHAIAAGGFITIGCERHSYDEWIENGEKIGEANGYTAAEIARYMAWIKMSVDWLRPLAQEANES